MGNRIMAGSITLHWRERLTDDEIYVIQEILERYADCDDECYLHDELTTETELHSHEVEQLVDEHVGNI